MVIIKNAVSENIETIGEIYEKSFEKQPGILKYYPGFNKYVTFCIDGGYAYVAIEEDIICGVLLAYEKPDMQWGKSLYVELLAVIPEFQRKGIGTDLLNRLKYDAQENGLSELSLRTGCYMNSYEIYKKYGFKDARADQRFMYMNIRKAKDENLC